MVFIIHGTDINDVEDSVRIEGSSIEDIKTIAQEEIKKRQWTNYWSEEIGGGDE